MGGDDFILCGFENATGINAALLHDGVVIETIFFAMAFVCGFFVLQVGLPPLVGFLAAGFIMNGMGFKSTLATEKIAELGVTLLLFSIGLKLDIRSLLRTHIWAPATLNLILSTGSFDALLSLFIKMGFSLFAEID